MNYSLGALVLIIFSAFLSNAYLASARTTKQSDSGLQKWKNEGRLRHNVADDTNLEKVPEESWHIDDYEDRKSQHEKGTHYKERIETGREFLNKLNNPQESEPVMKENSENQNSPLNGKEDLAHKRQQQSKSHVTRSDRKRHNRKFKKEIEALHNELSHIAEDLKEISAKETELEDEIDELKQLSHKRGRSKKSKRTDDKPLGKHLPRVKDGGHNLHGDNENTINEPHEKKASDTFHSFEDDTDFDLMEIDAQDLEDRNADSESSLREVMTDSQKDLGEVINKNTQLRRRNRELCRLLHLSLVRQNDLRETQENRGSYEDLDENSSGNREAIEERFLKVCGRSFREKETGRPKNSEQHTTEDNDETETENASDKHSGHGEKVRRFNRKSRRQFTESLSISHNKKQRNRQSHDHDSGTQKSEQKLHRIVLRDEDEKNSGREAEEETILENDMIETDGEPSRIDPDDNDQNNKKSESWISSTPEIRRVLENSENEDGISLTSADVDSFLKKGDELQAFEKYQEEEEANLTISTDDEDKQRVYDHIASVDEVTFCGIPRPVVIYPSDHYPVPNKYYTPQGTILHRCSKHSGCCPNEHLTCVPAKKESVVLNFFAAVLDGSSAIVPHIEKLRFVNHTKCGCVFKHHAHLYL